MTGFLNRYKAARLAVGGLLLALLLPSCSEEEEAKLVDLRYRAEDTYNLPASDPQRITIQVKSSDPWEVYSEHPEWCTISPDRGEPGETFDVVIQYASNVELDDRTDTITVQSDYWVGKTITVYQKGIAYLNTSGADDLLLGKDGEDITAVFDVLANQDWTAAVTEGEAWLSIRSGASGSGDGSVTVAAVSNPGEKRYGTITLFDRHQVAQQAVLVTQDGIQIDPDNSSFREDYAAHEIAINVIANVGWTVTKDDESQEWYSFSATSFDGDGTLIVSLDENEGSSIRKATFSITSETVPGVEPVVRTITIKQAYYGTVRYYFDEEEGAKWATNNGTCSFSDAGFYSSVGRVTRAGMEPGYYSFHIKEMSSDARTVIFFTYNSSSQEIRWHLDMPTGQTLYSTLPYMNVANKAFDKTKGSYTLGLSLTEASDGNMDIAWYLDGELCATSPTSIGVVYGTNSFVYVGTAAGSATYDWWEYTPNLDWGD